MKLNYAALNSTSPISDTGEATQDTLPPMPSYMMASDNHNYGNGNFAVTDPSTWGEGLSNAGKFITVAAASGLNSFYNSGAQVANWLGADVEQNDVATQLSAVDDDLGKYYKDNKNSADLAGFVLSSIVPGLGGIKLLNAGQKILRGAQETGMIGANLSRVTGLLTPSSKAYTTLAAGEIAQSSAAFSLTTGNALKAIGAGYGQAALESAAFEIAVNATQFKSPTLSDADGWDIAKNIAVGTVLGGAIGGAINHAVTYGNIKNAVKSFNIAEKQFTDVTDLRSLTPAQQIIARNDRLSTLPEAPSGEQIINGEYEGAQKLLQDLPASQRNIVGAQLGTKLSKLRSETETSLQLKNRTSFQELAGNRDPELANQVSDITQGLSGNQTLANMESLTELGRINSTLKAEKEITAHVNKIAKNPAGILDGSIDATLPKKIGYVKLSGEDIGKVTFEEPKVLSLGDMHSSSDEVMKTVKGFGFKENKPWSAIESANHNEAEARYIWADNAKLIDGTKIGEHDIPLLERALELKLNKIEVVSDAGNYEINTAGDLVKHLQVSKGEVADELIQAQKSGVPLITAEIAKITNVKTSFLEGEQNTANAASDMFARQSNIAAYARELESKGFSPNEIEKKLSAYPTQPSYAKAAYDTSSLAAVDAHQVTGMAYIKTQQKLYQQGIDNVFSANVPEELANRFWHPGDDMMLKTNRFGSGPGLLTFANGGYHTPESWAEAIGSASSALQKSLKDSTTDSLNGVLNKLVTNQEAAIEFESINKTIMSTSELYGINAEGTALEPLKHIDWKTQMQAGKKVMKPALQEGAPEIIPITNPDVLDAWTMRTQLTSNRTQAFQDIRNAQGLTDMKDVRALRPIRPDPKDYPYYAVVEDPSITGVGHKSMIHAASAKELDELISKVPSNYNTYKGDQLKEYFKAQGEFDYERTLHENYIDADLKRSGVNNPFFMRTDPQKIAQSVLQDHLRSDDIFARELVNAKYEKEFGFLRQQGEQFTSTATSKYTGSFRDIENSTKNPYLNYIKTALNISQVGEHPYIMGLNQKLDAVVSKGWNTITQAAQATKSVEDLDSLNGLLDKFGVKSAYYDAATELLANHSAPRGVLTKFIGRANNIISTLVTRLDPLNSINNAVGSTILYGSELKSVLNSARGDGELLGAMNGMLKTPRASSGLLSADTAGNVEQVMTSGKVMQQAVKNWFDKEATTASGIPLKEYYKTNGWSTKLVDQAQQLMQDLTLTGSESVGTINAQMQSAFKGFKELVQQGEKYSGNKYAEEFNRFVSADSMRQITDMGIKAGRITEDEAKGYINTFVNRTQGNILASQRPLMFQGPVGQAVGLFQSYQFNLMQQLFRHVSEGAPKDAAMLLGLQGTMYGMNGLPGFNYLNQHIVGTMSGNPKHQDLYSATYGVAGKSIGDLLLYGLPSNMLRANLYTRGDINPRQVTVIPVNPLDIPFVNASMKLYDNVSTMLSRTAGGASVWQTMLQGIEHNGLSRPLAGIAQTAQAADHQGLVFATTSKGSISGANDVMSWATAARLAGGKPFDESIANDQAFRITAYQAADRVKMDNLNQAIKVSTIAGAQPSPEQIGKFAADYAAIGGKQAHFNKYMIQQIKSADVSRANSIMENLKNPYSQKMQQVMGGTEGLDGRSVLGVIPQAE